MSTITKEWLQQTIAEMEEHRDLFPGDLDDNHANVLAALRIALASLEAEAVAFRSKLKPPYAGSERWDYTDHRQPDAFELENCFIERLYTAPPAPVSVPDEDLLHMAASAIEDLLDHCDPHTDYYSGVWADVPDKLRRAAMLQGAENAESRCTIQAAPALDSSPKIAESRCSNSPVIPDGWKLLPVEPTPEMQSAAAGAIRFDTTPINKLWTGNAVYKAMLAAAPQQEVKNG